MLEGPPKLNSIITFYMLTGSKNIKDTAHTFSTCFEIPAKWREIHSLFSEKCAPSMEKFFLLTGVGIMCGVMRIMLKEVSATFTVFERVESSCLLFFLSRSTRLPLCIKLC